MVTTPFPALPQQKALLDRFHQVMQGGRPQPSPLHPGPSTRQPRLLAGAPHPSTTCPLLRCRPESFSRARLGDPPPPHRPLPAWGPSPAPRPRCWSAGRPRPGPLPPPATPRPRHPWPLQVGERQRTKESWGAEGGGLSCGAKGSLRPHRPGKVEEEGLAPRSEGWGSTEAKTPRRAGC